MASRQQRAESKSNRVKIFVGKIGPRTTPASLRSHFDRFGSIIVARIEVSKCSGKKKGFGYVIFESLMNPALLLTAQHILDQHQVEVDLFLPEVLSFWHRRRQESIKLEVGDIPASAKDVEVFEALESRLGSVLLFNSNDPRNLEKQRTNRSFSVEIERNEQSLKLFSSLKIYLPEDPKVMVEVSIFLLYSIGKPILNGSNKNVSNKNERKTSPEQKTRQKSDQENSSRSHMTHLPSRIEMLNSIPGRPFFNHSEDNIQFNIRVSKRNSPNPNQIESWVRQSHLNSVNSKHMERRPKFAGLFSSLGISSISGYKHF